MKLSDILILGTLLFFLSALFSGCATVGESMGIAPLVKSTKDGGRIILNGTGTWMEDGSRKKADLVMKEKCPNGFEIIEEGLMQRPVMVTTYASFVNEKYLEFKCLNSVGQR